MEVKYGPNKKQGENCPQIALQCKPSKEWNFGEASRKIASFQRWSGSSQNVILYQLVDTKTQKKRDFISAR